MGTKTTIWFYNHDAHPSSIANMLALHRPARMYVHEWTIPDTAPLLLQAACQYSGVDTQTMRVKKQFLADMTDFLGEKYTAWSSGAIATWLLLQERECVTLAGFDWWYKPVKFHYMNGQQFRHSIDSRHHQPKTEKRFYDRLSEVGRLQFLYE